MLEAQYKDALVLMLIIYDIAATSTLNVLNYFNILPCLVEFVK